MLILKWQMGRARYNNIRMANEGERGMLILEWLMGRVGYGNIRMANQGEQGILNQGLHVHYVSPVLTHTVVRHQLLNQTKK